MIINYDFLIKISNYEINHVVSHYYNENLFTGTAYNSYGKRKITYYIVNGVLHKDDGPARICSNGEKCWYKEGKLHRENGPAVEYCNGTKEWYYNGEEIANCECVDDLKLYIRSLPIKIFE